MDHRATCDLIKRNHRLYTVPLLATSATTTTTKRKSQARVDEKRKIRTIFCRARRKQSCRRYLVEHVVIIIISRKSLSALLLLSSLPLLYFGIMFSVKLMQHYRTRYATPNFRVICAYKFFLFYVLGMMKYMRSIIRRRASLDFHNEKRVNCHLSNVFSKQVSIS